MQPPSHADYLSRRSFALLDGLRCFSILAVLWYHVPREERAAAAGWLPAAAQRLADRGLLGVDLFFVLSGFLITTLLLRERDRNGRISLPAFYARRTLRIFPIYYATVAGFCVWFAASASPLAQVLREPFFASLVHYVTYTSNWVTTDFTLRITWSLSTEEQFYLVWPPLLVWLGVARATVAALLLLAVNLAALAGAFDGLIGGVFRPNAAFAATTFAPILLGVLAAIALHTPRGHGIARSLVGARAIGPLLVLAVLAAASLPEGPPLVIPSPLYPDPDVAHFRGIGRMATHFAMAALLVHCVVQERTPLRHVLGWRPVVHVGRISYGMYLLHAPLFLVWWSGAYAWFGLPTKLPPLPALAVFAGLSAVTIGLATASFHGLEQPFLRLKRRFER